VVLDLASVLGSVVGGSGRPIVVRAVELDQPKLRLIKLEDGTANWDITKKTPAAQPKAAGKPLAISLRRFEIKDGTVAFDNRQVKLKTVVNLRKFHLQLGRNPVDATLVLRTPISDPDVDARVKGKIDLADVRRTVKLDGFDQLAGTVAADAAVRTRMSYVDRKQYDRVAASGTVDVAGLTVKGKGLPHPLAIQQASGSLQNLLAFAMRGDTLRGVARVRSNRFNLDEWRSGKGDLQIMPVPPKIDFDLDATVAELTYGKLKMANARGRLRVKDQHATLEDFRMNTLGGEIGLAGDAAASLTALARHMPSEGQGA
jgi:uncharacterized protein involved in outer membrane biogenesis